MDETIYHRFTMNKKIVMDVFLEFRLEFRNNMSPLFGVMKSIKKASSNFFGFSCFDFAKTLAPGKLYILFYAAVV